MTLFFIIIALGFSWYFIVRYFGQSVFLSSLEMIAISWVLGIAVFAGLASILMIIFTTATAGIFTFFITICFGFFSIIKLKKLKQKFWIYSSDSLKKTAIGLTLSFFISVFLILLIANSLKQNNDGSVSLAKGAAVDTPYHLFQVTRIGMTQKWDFEEPNFSGEFIRYPYFINLISGILYKAGASLAFSFHFPAFILAISGIYLLLIFFRSLGFGNALTFLSVFGTLFGSGLGYISYFAVDSISPLPIRLAAYPMQDISYPGMIPGFLVVQRPFLLGFPLFLIFALLFIRGIKLESRPSLFGAGLTAGLLPLSHSHSFLTAIFVSTPAIIYLFFFRKEIFFDSIRYFGFVFSFLAIPQLAALLLLPKFVLGSAVSLRLGWMSYPGDIGGINLPHEEASKFIPWLRLMWTNFGFQLFLPAALMVFAQKNFSNKVFILLFLSALSLWTIPNIAQFQVWDFDTNKFFAYAIMFSLAAIGVMINSIPNHYKKTAIIALALLVILSIPSALIASFNIVKYQNRGRVTMFSEDERTVIKWFTHNTSENIAILSSSSLVAKETVQNPIAVGSGRKATAGFLTWLYTHGIDFEERSAGIKVFFDDPSRGQELFDTKNQKFIPADYLVIDDILREKYPELEKKMAESGFKKIFEKGGLAVYDLAHQ